MMMSFGCQFDFHDVIYHISLVTLTIDGVTPVLQLMDVQRVHKICISVHTRVSGNYNTLFKMVELL